MFDARLDAKNCVTLSARNSKARDGPSITRKSRTVRRSFKNDGQRGAHGALVRNHFRGGIGCAALSSQSKIHRT